MEFLKSFDLSLWWRALIAVGVVLATAAMAAKERDVLLIALGLIAFGWGEWLNRPRVGQIEFGMLKTWYVWKPCISGLLLDTFGLLLIALGFYRLLTA